MRSFIRSKFIRHRHIFALLAAVTMSSPALAEEYNFGELNLTLDNTASASASIRTSKQSCDHISPYNGGCKMANGTSWDVNSDDGDINVQRGELISAPLKIISELGGKWQNYGFFVRAKAFWDPVAYDLGKGSGNYGPVAAPNAQRRPLQDAFRGDDAYNRELRQMKLLDAFAYGDFNVFNDLPLNVRVGRQAINWGESLFIPGGISSFLPLDVAAFTKPGTELKEIFLPQNTLYGSLGLPANFTFEAMYIMEWDKSPLPPCGTFFSPSDALSDGCAYALSSGEEYTNPDGSPRNTPLTPLFVPRMASINAREQGQWGAALRYYAGWLNDGTDLGTYFVNFHDKLPIGTFTADNSYVASSALALATGGDMTSPLCSVALPFSDDAGNPVRACAGAFGVDAKGKRLLAEYPEDIHMIGTSFNTTIADFMNGTALSGELAYFPNMPFQVDTTELLGADAYNAGFRTQPGQASIYNGPEVAPGDVIPGYRRTKALHGQIYTLSTLPTSNWLVQAAGGDLMILVANAGFQYLPNGNGNRFMVSRSGTTHPNAGMAGVYGDPCTLAGTCSLSPQYATTFSWGYRLLAIMQYNSVFGTPYTMSPRAFFAHDVKGYSAGPIGPGFIEGVKTVGLGVDFDYKSVYKLSLDYSSSFGDRYRNPMIDKDFASAALSYAF
ncbi:MAG: DUF1302 domain-containing protein [Parvibaculum sp.]|uniref:DUF1302 domain-containing protein n=1 Tax=Parvibaculum sp. TaxID=2024848 RepID=UPI0028414589|nr:DUF1302 domain-containing protein [Parvibaculum sp.]MDR3499074.1 DUF1302 domain-containing protein [Parvibaculum sp.]